MYLTSSRERMPPPNCTGTSTARRMSENACTFTGTSAASPTTCPKAPSKFTTWSHSAPSSTQCRAIAEGSWLKTVSALGSPWRSRTQAPLRKSIAGNTITRYHQKISGLNSIHRPAVTSRDNGPLQAARSSTVRIKLVRIRRPTCWLFSGWHWMPQRLPDCSTLA